MTPNTIQFSGTDSTWVMRITADRRIEVNEDVEVTEAAQKVLDALQHLLKIEPVQEPVATVTSESGNPDVAMSWWHEPPLPVGTKLYTTPPAAQPAPVKVWEAEGYDALMKEMQMVKARNIRQHAEIERLKAAPVQPVKGCQHKRYSVDAREGTGTCHDCGAEGQMQFVVGDTSSVATPPASQRQWVGLTDEERTEIRREH